MPRTPSQVAKMARNKGANGEREAILWLGGLAAPVCAHLALPPPVFERNLKQTREGGYDIEGLDWLALEIKRVETEYQPKWWEQTRINKRSTDQIACLLYRKNRQPWRARVELTVNIGPYSVMLEPILDQEQFSQWFRWQLYHRLGTSIKAVAE
jgi:hypothetical protein